MRIGLIDADLLDNGTRFPNLALMKQSSYYRNLGNDTELLHCYEPDVDKVIVSKVFTKTNLPNWINLYKWEGIDVEYGGTGFNLYEAPQLPYEIEHSTPDYSLYERYIDKYHNDKKSRTVFTEYYTDCSIGFTTRGCIRQCPFCVNRNKKRVERWSSVSEFYDPSRRYLIMLDDNILAYPKWEDVFDELEETGKPIRYIQGMDVRLMTARKAERIERIKYHNDVCFAFDNIADRDSVERGLALYRSGCPKKRTLAYVLVGFYKSGEQELEDAIYRVESLISYKVDPYIMKHENYKRDQFSNIYTELARWANNRSFGYMTFGDFFEDNASSIAKTQILNVSDNLRNRMEKLKRRHL